MRRIGARMRRGCSTRVAAVRPLAQKSRQLCGFALSAEILTTRLPSTVTSIPQEARQYRQKVCTVRLMPPWCRSAASPSPDCD